MEQKMIFNIHLVCFIVLLFGTINALPYYRYRRQINSPNNLSPLYEGLSGRDPSGSIKGTYYYGIGTDPNYGSFIQRPNTAQGSGISAISYNPSSNLFSNLVRPSHQHQQQQQQRYSSNYNNAWQGQNAGNYYKQVYNPYAPGSQGWYATGSNYWFNKGQSTIVQPYLLIISIVLLVFCN